MTELYLEMSKFDKIVNPDNLRIYNLKAYDPEYKVKGYNAAEPTWYNMSELIEFLMSNPGYNPGIDTSQIEYVCVDVDKAESVNQIKSELDAAGISYIQITSAHKGSGHFYMKKTDKVRWGKMKKYPFTAIHDYYRRNARSPFSPIIPCVGNGRTFLSLPATVDYIPDFMFEDFEETILN